MTKDELQAIRTRCGADMPAGNVYATSNGGVVLLNGPFSPVQAQRLVDFHQHARTDMQALLRELDAWKRRAAELESIASDRL